MKVIGVDAAFAHMGLASATIDLDTLAVAVTGLKLVTTEGETAKSVRKNSSDLRRAIELKEALVDWSAGASLAFIEVPQGSQSARAAWSLGIAVGVIASCPIPIVQVSPTEVKLATTGNKKASKEQMIAWAVEKHAKADWLRQDTRILAKNEHLADAIAAVYAGLWKDDFKQLRFALRGPTPRRVKIL